MISSVATSKSPVVRNGNFETHQFTIANSPEAFRILSDGLYSDKVTAVLRELGTNAIDAHIEAGLRDKPFHVHLPNEKEPWFRIRDFGPGLSHEMAVGLYTTYFGTTKNETNELIGQLGLGSKSPLAYCGSFTVTSYHKGEKRQYIVTLDEDRMPQVNYMPDKTVPSTEPSGLEIQFAVRYSDFREFSNKAPEVYRHFKTFTPTVTGAQFSIPKQEILVEGKGWRIYKGQGRARALMGFIAYPIAAEKIHNISAHETTILQSNIEIDFEIGELEFTPSREHLSYKKRTSDALRAKLGTIVMEVNAQIAKRFANAKSLWEARVLAYSMFWAQESDLRHLSKLADVGAITYKGKALAGQQLHFDKIAGVEAWSFSMRDRDNYGYSWSSRNRDNGKVRRYERKYFTPRSDIVWAEVDLPRGSYSRCEDIVRSDIKKEVYLVSFANAQARTDFCELMGLNGDEFVKTSSLPKPSFHRGVFHQSTSQVYKHNGMTSAYRFYKYWTEASVDLSDGGVYVEMRRNKVFHDNKEVDPAEIGRIMTFLNSVGHPVEVIGVRPTVAQQFKQSDDWVDLYEYVKNVIRTQIVSNGLDKDIANTIEYVNLYQRDLWANLIKEMRAYITTDTTSPFFVFLRHVQLAMGAMKKTKDYNAWASLGEVCGYSFSGSADHKLANEAKKVFELYPMWQMCASRMSYSHITSAEFSTLGKYIQLIDAQNSEKAVDKA